ncbi:MAG: hypothetical protein NT027_08575 [Proteobacteria bacterium]|nr:hypothetical protein [Pseudomonadota bacterium]
MSHKISSFLQVSLATGFACLSVSVSSFAQDVASSPAPQGGRDTMTYMIPQGSQLSENLILPIDRAKLRFETDYETGLEVANLDYTLPKEIDGAKPKRFSPSGAQAADGSWNLKEVKKDANGDVILDANGNESVLVTAKCTGDQKDFSCEMHYTKEGEGADSIFPVNTAAAEQYLATRPDLSPVAVANIKLGQVQLMHEPIGIVRVKRHRGGGHGGRN